VATRHPTIRQENTSITNAAYAKPRPVPRAVDDEYAAWRYRRVKLLRACITDDGVTPKTPNIREL
jgi:hypothetical protein